MDGCGTLLDTVPALMDTVSATENTDVHMKWHIYNAERKAMELHGWMAQAKAKWKT